MAKQAVVRAQALDGHWEVIGADRALGIWPENVSYEFDEWGPSRLSFDLRRDGSRPWPDLGAFTPVELLVGGAVVWDGRVSETPSRIAQRTMNVQCEGWQYHLDDDVFDAGYVHNDLSAWKDSRSDPAASLLALNAGYNVEVSSGVIAMTWPTLTTCPPSATCGVFLDLGPGCSARRIYVQADANFPAFSYTLYAYFSDIPYAPADPNVEVALNGIVAPDTASHPYIGTVSKPHRYVMLRMVFPQVSNTAITGDHYWRITKAMVFADPAYGAYTNSVLRSTDVVLDSLSRGTTLLSPDRSRVRSVSVFAKDNFNQTSGNLAGKALDVGGTWSGAGAATDFLISLTASAAARQATSDTTNTPRLERAGTAAPAAVVLQADVWTDVNTIGSESWIGLFARYTDVNNYLWMFVRPDTGHVVMDIKVGGSIINIASIVTGQIVASAWYRMRLSCDETGLVKGWFGPAAQGVGGDPLLIVRRGELKTGGQLASGGFGLYDINTSATAATRLWDTFVAYEGSYGTDFNIPTFWPTEPQTARQNWQAVDAYQNWIKKIEVGRVPVYEQRPTAPVLEVGEFSAIDDEDASANSGEDIYNKIIVTGQTPDSVPVRATGTSAASPAGQTIVTAIETQQLDVGGAGAAGFNSIFKIRNHVPYLVRILAVTRNLGSGGLPIDVYAGWPDFDSGTPQNTGDMIHFGAVPVPYSGAPISAVWTPTKLPDDAVFGIGVTAPGGGTAGSIITIIADLVWGGTVADRRGFARAKLLPISSALPADLVAGSAIGSTWAASHRSAPFRGSAPVTGDGAVRIIDSGEAVPLERLGQYTGQLLLFGDRPDPDTGGWGRVGKIVGVSYSPGSEAAVITIDNTRSSFEALMARFDLLSR